MDQKTREARRRMKAARTPRGELSPFEARGLGRKGKPHQTFPQARCEYDSGQLSYFKKPDPNDPTKYKTGVFRKNSDRCLNSATTVLANGKRACDEHIAILKLDEELA